MTDWGLAIQIFASGIGVVMTVMVTLILTINVSSVIVQSIERRLVKAKE